MSGSGIVAERLGLLGGFCRPPRRGNESLPPLFVTSFGLQALHVCPVTHVLAWSSAKAVRHCLALSGPLSRTLP